MALVIGKKETRKFKVTAEETGDFLEVTKHIFEVEFKIIPKNKLDPIRALAIEDMNLIVDDIKDAHAQVWFVVVQLITAVFIELLTSRLPRHFFSCHNQRHIFKALRGLRGC